MSSDLIGVNVDDVQSGWPAWPLKHFVGSFFPPVAYPGRLLPATPVVIDLRHGYQPDESHGPFLQTIATALAKLDYGVVTIGTLSGVAMVIEVEQASKVGTLRLSADIIDALLRANFKVIEADPNGRRIGDMS